MTYTEIIKKWKLNQVKIADLMAMPVGTFKNKLNENQAAYHFTPDEEKKLCKVLKDMGADIKKLSLNN